MWGGPGVRPGRSLLVVSRVGVPPDRRVLAQVTVPAPAGWGYRSVCVEVAWLRGSRRLHFQSRPEVLPTNYAPTRLLVSRSVKIPREPSALEARRLAVQEGKTVVAALRGGHLLDLGDFLEVCGASLGLRRTIEEKCASCTAPHCQMSPNLKTLE